MSGSVVVLNWHGIGAPPRRLDPGEDQTWVSTDAFEQILDLVTDRPDVQITLDDGNASDVEIALPRLVERGLTATFFVLAGRLGHKGSLDAQAVRELVAAGMSVGSHGWAHRDWRMLSTADVNDELVRAPSVLADITGREVRTVAIPFGSYDRRVLSRLRRAGVSRAYTSDGGRTDTGRWLQSRNSLRHDTTRHTLRSVIDERPSALARPRRAAVLWAKRNRIRIPTASSG